MSFLGSLRDWLRRRKAGGLRKASRRPPPSSALRAEPLEDRRLLAAGLNSLLGTFQTGAAAWYLRGQVGPGAPDVAPFAYGGANWVPVGGDWTGSGQPSIGAFDPSTATWYLRTTTAAGAPDITPFRYGAPGWIPVVGDWTGTGHTGIGVFDPATATFYLRTEAGPGAPDAGQFRYGAAGWTPVVGDWDGNGKDSVGVFDPGFATFYLRNSNGPGAPDITPFAYGARGWVPVAGDWDGNGKDSVGVVDPGFATWYLRNTNGAGAPDLAPFAYGGAGWNPVVLAQPTVPLTAPQSVRFEANQGQVDPQALYLAHTAAGTAFFTPDGVVLAMPGQPAAASSTTGTAGPPAGTTPGLTVNAGAPGGNSSASPPAARVTPDVPQRFLFAGHSAGVQVEGQLRLVTRTNYFIGADPSQWHTDVPNYDQVRYRNVYPGIDAIVRGDQGRLTFDYEVAPGANPAEIVLGLPDAAGLSIDPSGQLLIGTSAGSLTLSRPVFYQQGPAGNQPVSGGYVLRGGNQVGFQVGPYDPARPLYIDPTMSYSTFVGGSDEDDGTALAVDAAGNAVAAGQSASTNFPATAGAFQTANSAGQGDFSIVVSKVNPQGTALLWATYIGGNKTGANAFAEAVALDASGGVYVAGSSDSDTGFPTTQGAYHTGTFTNNGSNALALKLSPAGDNLVYSTYLAGENDFDIGHGNGIAVDAAGNAYVTGDAITSFQATAGAFQTQNSSTISSGGPNAFVAKLNPTGTGLVYGTYLSGKGNTGARNGTLGYAVAVDGSGNAYVTGRTDASNFPTTTGAFQTALSAKASAFVAKLNPTGTALVYSTFLGGSAGVAPVRTEGHAIALDAAGNAYAGGWTESSSFPITTGAFEASFLGTGNSARSGYVTKLNPAGTAAVYSTYLGGNNKNAPDDVFAVAVDSTGDAYAGGFTGSTNFPTVNPTQASNAGQGNGTLAVLNPSGTAALFSTYLGGSKVDSVVGVGLDAQNNIYVSGDATSSDFPTTPGALQTAYGGGNADLYVAKFNAIVTPPPPPPPPPLPPPPPPVTPPPGGGGTTGGAGGAGGALTDDRFEPNDTSDVATDMGAVSGLESFGTLTITRHANGLFDQDWYKFSVPSGGVFDVNLTEIHAGGGDIHVRVFRLNGDDTLTEIANSLQVGGFSTQGASAAVGPNTTVYVWVYGFNFAVGAYNLNVNLT